MRSTIIAGMLALGACTSAGSDGGDADADTDAGPVSQRSFAAGEFQSVRSQGAYDVIITVGGPASVRAEGSARALERLEIEVENGALKIGTRREGWSMRHHGNVTVHVTTPSLNGAQIEGSGDMRIDRVEAPAFAASISGSGDMEVASLQARQARFSIAGSGDISAAGAAEEVDISIAGSGDVELGALEARRASVSVAGSGDISLRASESVGGSIMGSGSLRVQGNARCSVSKMGSGEIHCG